MNMNQSEQYLQASVKSSVLTQIFSNMSKQLKQTQCFYLAINGNGIKIGVRQLSQTIEIELNLHAKIFSTYDYEDLDNNDEYMINKYSLGNFQFFDSFFQTCKSQIKIKVSAYRILFTDQHQKNKFISKRLFIDQQQLQLLRRHGFANSQNVMEQGKKHVQVKISKIRFFEQVIHTSSAFKEEVIQIWYKSNKLNFKVNQKINKKLRVQQIRCGQTFEKAKYPVKKMKLATSLLESQKQVILSIYQGYIVFKYEQDNKKSYQIKICSISQTLNQQF